MDNNIDYSNTCEGCGNPVDLCICEELEYYTDQERENLTPEYYEPD